MIIALNKLSAEKIRSINLATSKSSGGDSVFIDTENKFIYYANTQVYIRINIQECLQGDPIGHLGINREEFLNILKNSKDKDLEISPDGKSYKLGIITGKLQKGINANFTFSGVRSFFTNFHYVPDIQLNEIILALMEKSAVFVNPSDGDLASQCLHVSPSGFASSSLRRVYLNRNINLNTTVLIHNNILKYLFMLKSPGVQLGHFRNYMVLEQGDILLVFTSLLESAEVFNFENPRFKTMLQALEMSGSKLKLQIPDLKYALNYLSIYWRKNTNNRVSFTYDPSRNVCIVSAGEAEATIEVQNSEGMSSKRFSFFINAKDLLDVLQMDMYFTGETVSLSYNENFAFCLLPIGQGENIILGTIADK